jgi:hypothetical protein
MKSSALILGMFCAAVLASVCLTGCGDDDESVEATQRHPTIPGHGQTLVHHEPNANPAPVQSQFVLAIGFPAEPTGFDTLIVGPGGKCRLVFFQKSGGTYAPRLTKWTIGNDGYEQIRTLVQAKAFVQMHRLYIGPPGTDEQLNCALISPGSEGRWEVRCDNHTPEPLAQLVAHCQKHVLPKANLDQSESFDIQDMLNLWMPIE